MNQRALQHVTQPHSLADVFRDQARDRGQDVAIRDAHSSVTFAMLDHVSNKICHMFQEFGLKKGDRVAVLGRNSVEFFYLLGAAAKMGVVLCPINFRLTANEIVFILDDADPALVLVARDFLSTAENAVTASDKDVEIIVLESGTHELYHSLAYLLNGRPALDPLTPVDAEGDVLLLYTSGTTGHPKGVRVTHANYGCVLQAFPNVPGFAFDAGNVVASTMPLFHIAGINVGMSALSQSCEILLYSNFEPPRFLSEIESRHINYAFLAPSMIADLVNAREHHGFDFSSMKVMSYGASSIPMSVLHSARTLFTCDFAQLYGMTESTGAGTYLTPAAHDLTDKFGSCGVAWPGMEMKIVGLEGEDLSPMATGELVMRGGFVSPGYFENEEATELSIRNGWLHTGDAGYVDAEGFFFIKDRIKDMIITGGENVSPAEVENAIAGCPGVREVAVIGIPSEKWGEEIRAVIVPDPEHPPTEADVISWARKSIAGFKVPKSIELVASIPRNAAGKVLKRQIRDKYWKNADRRI